MEPNVTLRYYGIINAEDGVDEPGPTANMELVTNKFHAQEYKNRTIEHNNVNIYVIKCSSMKFLFARE